ncbi:MAG: GTP-binding protein [Lachnospiraceae bacterium]
MIQIDLITGFLGSGKTTFIREYAKYFLDQGLDIGILENDFGAVNVDAMLLQDILGEHCSLEMVAGGCDADCHKRRFKTKLITIGMYGYDRVLVEPSGIFDMDEFFDTLHEEPLDRWYEVGNVITIIDAGLDRTLSDASRYILVSQAAQAGTVLYSHTNDVTKEQLAATKRYVEESFEQLHCKKNPNQLVIEKDFESLQKQDFEAILSSGYQTADYAKLWSDEQKTYDSLCFMNLEFSKDFLLQSCKKILEDPACGNVFRIKGFQKFPDGHWISINATRQKTDVQPIADGQSVLIVIGEHLHQDAIEKYWGKSNF